MHASETFILGLMRRRSEVDQVTLNVFELALAKRDPPGPVNGSPREQRRKRRAWR